MIIQARLKELLYYDPETGAWVWRVERRRGRPVGLPAGKEDSHGYLQITIDGVRYLASRLAFLWMLGEWPVHHVDHEDVDPSNNRWKNLRPATRSQNGGNKKVYRNNKLGIKGVHKVRSGNYEAQIQVNGKNKFLGTFYNIASASEAYRKAASEAFGEYHRTE